MLCHLGGSVGFKFWFLVVQIPRYWQRVYIDSKSLDYSIPLFIILHSDPKFFSAVFPLEWDGSMETMQDGIILEYTTWPWYIQHRFHSCLTAPWAFAKSKIRLLLAFFSTFFLVWNFFSLCWASVGAVFRSGSLLKIESFVFAPLRVEHFESTNNFLAPSKKPEESNSHPQFQRVMRSCA